MFNKFRTIPSKWKLALVFLLVFVHALPLLMASYLLWPNEQNTLKMMAKDPQLSFLQAASTLSVENGANESQLPSSFQIKLDSFSQTNQPTSLRQDITLLYQDGVLVKKNKQLENNTDTVKQQMIMNNKFNHLFQAISFHYAETAEQTYFHQMSDDYLYVSATKYGGIQSFHQPETVQQQHWKGIIDRHVHKQINDEYRDAFQKFEINPNDYYLFPLSQLPLYSQKEQLPGIPPEHSAELIRKIWNIIHEHIMMETNKNAEGSSMPLLLIAKDGTYFSILYRTADGHYHKWDKTVREELK